MEQEIAAAVNALGYLDGENYQKEPDCLGTIRDLIRYLRRDTTSSYKIRCHITSLNVIEKDLVPILRTYHGDAELFEATLRLSINLTQPVDEKKENTEELPAPVQSAGIHLHLINDLKRTKRTFSDLGFMQALTGKLRSVISLDWEQRQEEDRLLIERILIFIRNILRIPPPEEDLLEKTSCNLTVHDQIILSMEKSTLLSVVLSLASEDTHREFHVYVLEIVALILRDYSPEIVASTGSDFTPSDRRKEQQELAGIHAKELSMKHAHWRRCSGRSFAGAYTVHGVKPLNETKQLISPRIVTKTEDLSFAVRKHHRKIPRNRAPAVERVSDGTAFLSSANVNGEQKSLEVRRVLKDFCDRFIEEAYNNFMHSIQYSLERRSEAADADSRYHFWWTMKYFTAYVRSCDGKVASGSKWRSVNETLSLHCLHDAQTQLEQCLDMIKMEKKDAKTWGRKAHIVLKAYGEILAMIRIMDDGKDEEAVELATELKKTVFYVMEYRELLITLLKKYDPVVFTKSYLKDLVEITHVYMKMLETHCLVYGDELKVQRKRKRRRRAKTAKSKGKSDQSRGAEGLTVEEKKALLQESWDRMVDDVSTLLQEVQTDPSLLPTDVVAFDALATHGLDEKIIAQIRIQKALMSKDVLRAVALLRLSREIWPEETLLFGHAEFSPEDEFLLLQNAFFAQLPATPGENDHPDLGVDHGPKVDNGDPDEQVENGAVFCQGGSEDDSEGNDGSAAGYVTSEVQFSFNQYLQRFAHQDILRWYMILVADFSTNTPRFNHCLIKMLHRIAYDLKMAPILFQARLFRAFRQLINCPGFEHLPGANELATFAKHLLADFFRKAEENKNIFIEMMFWKEFKNAYEIEYGYGSYEVQKQTTKGTRKKRKRSDSGTHDPRSPVDGMAGDDQDDQKYEAPLPEPMEDHSEGRSSTPMEMNEDDGENGEIHGDNGANGEPARIIMKVASPEDRSTTEDVDEDEAEETDIMGDQDKTQINEDEVDKGREGSPIHFSTNNRRRTVAAIISDDEEDG